MSALLPRARRGAALLCIAASLSLFAGAKAQETQELEPRVYASMVMTGAASPAPQPPASQPDDWFALVNYYRSLAGVPQVSQDAALNDNCWQHSRYMAENNHLTHDQDEGRPFASAAGELCGTKGNVWIGGGTAWTVNDAFDGWMSSVGHRLWLLYPTTPTFGFGFYTAANREAAALDVLSRSNFGADTSYRGWPIRYPADGQSGIPADPYPITLMWRYFGSAPQLGGTSLRTEAGASIPHSASTSLPGGHKGVQIVPSAPLPDNTVFVVEVTGTYGGAPFSYSWHFATGGASPAMVSGGGAEPATAGEPPLPASDEGAVLAEEAAPAAEDGQQGVEEPPAD
jgi:uncharacterized protein YkwD